MNPLFEYLLRIGDDSLIIGQRLSEWCGHGPILEEDIAMSNIALDFIGQATTIFEYAAEIESKGRTADDLAFLRFDREYKNLILLEQPNGDFGMTMMRQFLFDSFRKLLFESLISSTDDRISAFSFKSLKETKYHLKHSSEWVIRLGDGTNESHKRIQDSLDILWRYTSELFYEDDIDIELKSSHIIPNMKEIKDAWYKNVKEIFSLATLTIPDNNWEYGEGRRGVHSEHLGYILTELQYMQRAYPGMEW